MERDLLAELRSALAHLHDLAYLERHPLCERLGIAPSEVTGGRGRELKRVLQLSIEALDPGPSVRPTMPEARPYEILRRCYIGRQTMAHIAAQLGISERYAYHELRRGLEALASIVANYASSQAGDAREGDVRAAQVRAEVERLSMAAQQQVDLGDLLATVVRRLERMSAARQVMVDYRAEVEEATVMVNRTMLRQALFNLMSHLLSTSQPGDVLGVRLRRRGDWVYIALIAPQAQYPAETSPESPGAIAVQLLESMSIPWDWERTPREVCISLRILVTKERDLLVVDDNAGLITLVRRYLRRGRYRVRGAGSAKEALVAMRESLPDVILLDVMMPERDGWDLLETIGRMPERDRIKVIVCSVINDPELALTLGADAFLHKPFHADELFRLLQSLSSAT